MGSIVDSTVSADAKLRYYVRSRSDVEWKFGRVGVVMNVDSRLDVEVDVAKSVDLRFRRRRKERLVEIETNIGK